MSVGSLTCGAGTRARHVYSLAIDLGLPVGVLTVLGTAVAWQNAQMLQYLLARHGVAFLEPEGFASLPHYLMERGAVICQGMPPYKLWEANPELGRIPPQRTDTGCFLIAEVFGARKMIYVKDEDGLFTADPKKDSNARFILQRDITRICDYFAGYGVDCDAMSIADDLWTAYVHRSKSEEEAAIIGEID